MSSPTFFSDGSSPRITDTTRIATEKILGALVDGGGGGGGGGSGGISSGAGDPVAAPTNVNIDNIYINRTAVPESGWLWPASGAAWEQIF